MKDFILHVPALSAMLMILMKLIVSGIDFFSYKLSHKIVRLGKVMYEIKYFSLYKPISC